MPPLTSPMSLGFIQFGPNPKVVLEIAPKSHCTMPMRLAPERQRGGRGGQYHGVVETEESVKGID